MKSNVVMFVVILLVLKIIITTNSLLLVETPMIMSHDAASGYLKDKDRIAGEVVIRYSKTQSGSLRDQLDCGARSFDYRPYIESDGTVIAHHGSTIVPVSMSESIMEIIDWFNASSSPQDQQSLILFYISHIAGRDCAENECDPIAVKAVLNDMNISYIDECKVLSDLTYARAFEIGSLQKKWNTPGSILAVFDCTSENYDSTVNCYGYSADNNGHIDKIKYTCYENDRDSVSNKEIAFASMEKYITNSTGFLQRPSENLWMVQAHWQSTTVSVPMGLAHNSSVTEDESRSKVNQYIAAGLEKDFLQDLNLLELDNVCDEGNMILELLRKRLDHKLGYF